MIIRWIIAHHPVSKLLVDRCEDNVTYMIYVRGAKLKGLWYAEREEMLELLHEL